MKYHVGVNHETAMDMEVFSYFVVATYKDRDKLIVIDEGVVYDKLTDGLIKSKFMKYCKELSEYYDSPILWENEWIYSVTK